MKTYFLDIIPSIIRSSRKLDDLTMIKNHHWVLIDTETSDKTVLIFLAGNRLKIVRNGISKNSTWEILENAYLDIDLIDVSLLVKYVFVDEDFLMLKVDSREEFFVFINETKFGKELNSIDQIRSVLKVKYPWGKIEKYHLLFSLVQKSYTYKMGHFSEYSVKFNDQVVSSVYFSTSKNCWFIYEKSGDILTFKSKGSFLNYLLP